MKLLSLTILLFATVSLGMPCRAQCVAPEVVKGADEFNALLCHGIAASRKGEYQKALAFFLKASKEPMDEEPNVIMFGRIAETYAQVGQFREADVYLKYEDLSLLWLIGVVRCDSQDENLVQDGEFLKSADAKHMVNVLCGPIFDNNNYFADRDAASFVPVARLILRYDALRKKIDLMRAKQHSH